MKNVAASVRARLTNQARATGVSLPSLIERFAIGRLLWRLSESSESRQFVLKEAQLFSLWAETPHRPTRDLDLLSFGDPSVDAMRDFFQDLLTNTVEPDDGLVWGELSVGPIRNDQRYGGVRVSVWVLLDGARIPVQVDIGFGDAITPAPEARKVSTRKSAALISIICTSSLSGIIATVAAEVCTRPCDSVSGTRCTRCAPDSNFNCE